MGTLRTSSPVSHFTPLCFPHKRRNIDLHTQVLIYKPFPKQTQLTDVKIFSTRANVMWECHTWQFINDCHCIIWLCSVISAEIQDGEDVEKGVLFLKRQILLFMVFKSSGPYLLIIFLIAFIVPSSSLWIGESLPNQQRRIQYGSPWEWMTTELWRSKIYSTLILSIVEKVIKCCTLLTTFFFIMN